MASRRLWTRREWLGAVIASAAGGALAACDDSMTGPNGEFDLLRPSFPGDRDAGLLHLLELDVLVTKGPYVQWKEDGKLRIRWESDVTDPLRLQVDGPTGDSRTFLSTVSVEEVDFQWPPSGIPVDFPDMRGLWALHEVVLDDLAPGAFYTWTLLGRAPLTGRFRTIPPKGAASSVAWISDTMFPHSERVISRLAEDEPELVLHGGDLQYQTNPLDTWNGFFHHMRPLLAGAAFQCCPGNHEYESMSEFEVQYRRLFEGQGDAGGTYDYFGITWAGIRFLLINSEDGFTPDSVQLRWLEQELSEADSRPDIDFAVVAFHRPFFTFSRSRANQNHRALLHPLFVDHHVPLVFTGHNHCYERFDIDGICYVMDGGGGALTYDINATIEDVESRDPHLLETRLTAHRTYGGTHVDIRGDGTLALRRVNEDGEIEDAWDVGPIV